MQDFLTNILSSVFGTGFLIIFYVIQIGKSLRVKSAKGISWIGWTMLNLALLCMFTSSVAVFIKFGTYGYMITETANVVLALVELFLILKYRKNDKRAELLAKQVPIVKKAIGFAIATGETKGQENK
jgi:uncharacterized protein with PQ loop repeat